MTALAFLALALSTMSLSAQEPPPYLDPSLAVEERAADLVSRMTLREKLGQLVLVNVAPLMGEGDWDRGPLDPERVRRMIVDLGVGSLLSGGGAAPVPNTGPAWRALVDTLQRVAVTEGRLGVPILYGVDAVHGHNNVAGATIFPHQLGLAATWDPGLVREIAARTALDVRSTGVHWNFAPVADLGRDPRWGRFYETFGEAPVLASRMVAAAVRGLQGQSLDRPDAVAATVKHFVGYSVPADGRDRAGASIDLRSLREAHLPPFRAGIEAGAATVMVNSGTVNGVPAHASPWLLRTVLREELGFDGLVVSDWDDVANLETWYRVAGGAAGTTARGAVVAAGLAVSAGVDLIMVPVDAAGTLDALSAAVAGGHLSVARVDEAAARVLTLKLRLGLFEDPYGDPGPAAAVGGDPHRALARKAAAESLTLLTNRDGTLPFGPDVRTVFVGGPGAAEPAFQAGGWTIGWQGVPEEGPLPPGTTLVEGLRAAGLEVLYHPALGAEAVADLRAADAAVVVLSEPPYAEWPGDTLALRPEPDEVALLRTAAALAPRTVAVLLTGRPWPVDLTGVGAALMAYLPGGEGGAALADVLTGAVDPGGRLPFTWPATLDRVPYTHDRSVSRWSAAPPGAPDDASGAAAAGGGSPPEDGPGTLFPFGHGLSYTRFEHRNASATVDGDTLRMTVEVANVGGRAGTEVVQAWVVGWPAELGGAEGGGRRGEGAAGPPRAPPLVPPERRLVAFEKVDLPPATGTGPGASAGGGAAAEASAAEAGAARVELSAPLLDALGRVGGDVPGTGPRTVVPGVYRLRVGSEEVEVRVRFP